VLEKGITCNTKAEPSYANEVGETSEIGER
jgi:hypothetical protein